MYIIGLSAPTVLNDNILSRAGPKRGKKSPRLFYLNDDMPAKHFLAVLGFAACFKRLSMTTTRISPTQVQANGYIYVFEDDEEADDFQACATGVDVAYCELEHAVISKLPIEAVRHAWRS